MNHDILGVNLDCQKFFNTMDQPTALKKKVHFKPITKLDGSSFYLDPVNKISCIRWKGVVEEDTARQLLTLAADSIEFEEYNKLLLDRSQLVEFSTGARVWIKHDLLKTRARKIVSKVHRVAFVNATDARGSIFSNFLSAGIKMVFPKLTMSKFDNIKVAVRWLVAN